MAMNTKDAAYLFHQGTYYQSYEFFGAHIQEDGSVVFRLWAPNARAVSVVGNFNDWNQTKNPMHRLEDLGGIWELTIPGLKQGDLYKYAVTQADGKVVLKADPYAFYSEKRPATASIIWDLDNYQWTDDGWIEKQRQMAKDQEPYPINIYEMHLGSWQTHEDGTFKTYDELAETLPAYLKEMGYTHVEFMPVLEHPFDGSWGYQVTGFYSATSRYGTPQGLMHLIDTLHANGIHVILDWVPGHFCKDEHGLRMLDGTYQYEAAEHPQWGTMEFNYAKPEVLSFLISNAFFWFKMFHADGLRIDGVASMLYLNYGYDDDWRRNEFGGIDDLAAVAFLRKCNTVIFENFPYAIMAAEESTAYPMVSWPVDKGGLGFNYKWDMGWMHDTLNYMQTDPYFRSKAQNNLTFSMSYAFSENFILPLSHDEVVHGKATLVNKMFGADYDLKFDQYRTLLAFMYTHSGKKLIFMGQEFAPFTEWRYYEQLEWNLPRDYDKHRQTMQYVKDLNHLYKDEKSLWQVDHSWAGYQWINADDNEHSVISYRRIGLDPHDETITVINFIPVEHKKYRMGVPEDREYHLILNSNDTQYGGTGLDIPKSVVAEEVPCNNLPYSVELDIPPMSALIFKPGKVNIRVRAHSKITDRDKHVSRITDKSKYVSSVKDSPKAKAAAAKKAAEKKEAAPARKAPAKKAPAKKAPAKTTAKTSAVKKEAAPAKKAPAKKAPARKAAEEAPKKAAKPAAKKPAAKKTSPTEAVKAAVKKVTKK